MRAQIFSALAVLGMTSATPALAQMPGADTAPSERPDARDRIASGDEMELSYVVKEGDTLSSIAEEELGRAGEWKQIASLNGIDDPKKLAVGKRLRLPGADQKREDQAAPTDDEQTDPTDSLF